MFEASLAPAATWTCDECGANQVLRGVISESVVADFVAKLTIQFPLFVDCTECGERHRVTECYNIPAENGYSTRINIELNMQ